MMNLRRQRNQKTLQNQKVMNVHVLHVYYCCHSNPKGQHKEERQKDAK